jgi:hypothetical protein
VPAPSALPQLKKNPLAQKVNDERVARVLASLDLRARAAQLLLAYPQKGPGPVEVGGVLFVGGALSNIAKSKERLESTFARASLRGRRHGGGPVESHEALPRPHRPALRARAGEPL